MRSLSRLFLLALIPGLALSDPELRGTPGELSRYLVDEKKIIGITGHGEVRVSADEAKIHLTVRTKDSKFRQALANNRSIRESIKDRLKGAGIDNEAVTYSRFSSTPNYGWFKDKPSSYEVSNEVKVTVNTEDEYLAVAEVVDAFPQVTLAKVAHFHTDKKASKGEALEQSLQSVDEKRKAYERALAVSLKPVRIVEQETRQQAIASYRPKNYDTKLSAPSSVSVGEYDYADSPATGFGEIVYYATTVVEFTLTPK